MKDYIELTKPRITWLILMSTAIGFYYGLPKAGNWWAFVLGVPLLALFHTVLGTGLIASGTAALNQWYERDADCRMRRTSARPIPAGRISPPRALAFGIALSIAGFLDLWLGVNLLAALLGLFADGFGDFIFEIGISMDDVPALGLGRRRRSGSCFVHRS